MISKEVIAEIRTKKNETLGDIYILYREEFVRWLVKSHNCTVDDAMDIYQNVILIFYENVLSWKVEKIQCDLKTYLFAIGKNKVMELRRRNFKMVRKEKVKEVIVNEQESDGDEREQQILKIEQKFELIGHGCRNLLKLFYYEKKSIREITKILGYKNEASAKNQKYKCMEKLRKLSFDN